MEAPALTRGALLRRSVFPLAVLAVLAVAAVHLLDMRQMGEALLRARLWPLAALLGLHLASTALHALRLRLLLRGAVSFTEAFHANNICNLVNGVLPLRAGEFAMAVILSRRTRTGGGEVLSNILVDRLLALLSVFLIFLCALPFAGRLEGGVASFARSGALYALCFLAAVACLYAVVRLEERVLRLCVWTLERMPAGSPQGREKLVRRLGDVIAGLRVLFTPRTSLPVFGVCLTCWCIISALNYCSMLAVIDDPSPVAAVFLTFFTIVGIMLVATPSGAGTVHGVTVLVLALFGVAKEQALAIAILVHGLVLIANVGLGVLSARAMKFRLGSLWGGKQR
jgi:uncharacterized protein (TIRG00374 family)